MADFFARDIRRLDRDLKTLETVLDSLREQALPRYIIGYVESYLKDDGEDDGTARQD